VVLENDQQDRDLLPITFSVAAALLSKYSGVAPRGIPTASRRGPRDDLDKSEFGRHGLGCRRQPEWGSHHPSIFIVVRSRDALAFRPRPHSTQVGASFIAECHYWVDFRRPAGGKVTREHGNRTNASARSNPISVPTEAMPSASRMTITRTLVRPAPRAIRRQISCLAFGDGIGHDTVQSDGREQQRDSGEDRHQPRHEPVGAID